MLAMLRKMDMHRYSIHVAIKVQSDKLRLGAAFKQLRLAMDRERGRVKYATRGTSST